MTGSRRIPAPGATPNLDGVGDKLDHFPEDPKESFDSDKAFTGPVRKMSVDKNIGDGAWLILVEYVSDTKARMRHPKTGEVLEVEASELAIVEAGGASKKVGR